VIQRVVDTNVVLVANNSHANVSPECVIACIKHLQALMDTGVVVVDDAYRILNEYQKKTTPRKAKGVGDVFVQWLRQHLRQEQHVHQVPLTEIGVERFAEFPDAALEQTFDPDDRKFAAVAHAHPDRPPICQAADCKWVDWWPALHTHGLRIEFICRDDICRFYASKFPGKGPPSLP
jgi:hypothetical protein